MTVLGFENEKEPPQLGALFHIVSIHIIIFAEKLARMGKNLGCCAGGVMALTITPRDDS